jgi:hypothetical protein
MITSARGSVHGLDGVAADAEFAQVWFDAGLQHPLCRAEWFGQAEPFELCGTAWQKLAQLRILS